MRISFCLLVLLLKAHVLLGWFDAGHMITAQIAWEVMHPQAREEAGKLIALLDEEYPESAGFIAASVWADDIRGEEFPFTTLWHGYALPYDPKGVLSEKERSLILFQLQVNNGVSMVREAVQVLKNPEQDARLRAYMLRMLLHVVGDLHQPLHCIQLYDYHFPNGDKAATRFKIRGGYTHSLHLYWDSGCGTLPRWRLAQDIVSDKELPRPVFHHELEEVRRIASDLMAEYPEQDDPERAHRDPLIWAEESYQLGIDVAYRGIHFGERPSRAYRERAIPVVRQRITLGGYRLGNLLNHIFDPTEEP